MSIKRQIYIIALIALLISAALIWFLVYPLIQGIIRESENFVSQKNDVYALKNSYVQMENFQQEYASYKPNLDKLDLMLIDANDPVNFIKFIEKTAADYQLKVEMSAPTLLQEGSLSFVSLQASCAGDFSGISKFVNALETGDYLIKVRNLYITNTSGTQKTPSKVQAMLSLGVMAK